MSKANVLSLSGERVRYTREALDALSRLIPDLDKMADCDSECQEISQMAAVLQAKLSKQLHHFGTDGGI